MSSTQDKAIKRILEYQQEMQKQQVKKATAKYFQNAPKTW